MKKPTDIPPLSRTDKLLALALAGCFLAPHLIVGAMDHTAARVAQEDKPAVEVVAVGCTPLVEAIKTAQADPYDETIPLSRELQTALREACEEHGVPLCLALGLIEVESGFQVDADNGVSTGLCQLNSRYYSSDLTPEENIQAGVAHLAGQIERYGGDIQAALRAYNRGFDDGARQYSSAVLDASEKWGCG